MKIIKGNNITFKTQIPALVDLAPPVPASQMIPDWFTKLRMDLPRPDHKPFPMMAGGLLKKWSSHTIKKCPAVVDYFAEGYIIPLWSDILIQRHGEDFHFETNHDQGIGSTIEFHREEQFATYPFKRKDLRRAVKFTSPWFFYTPPGWSMLFIPPLLHPNDDFTLFPGIVETDSFHQVNFPGVWHSEGDRILQRGDAFLHVIPFKRSKHKLKVEEFMPEDYQNNTDESFRLRSKMTNGYRDITRRNKKKWK